MKHRGDTDITSSIHIFIIYSKTSINSTALSMLDHKANDHSYSHRALFVSFTYLSIFEIREQTSLPEYTVRENDNYFVMHSSSLHLHGIESTHTCTFTCPFALCHYLVKSTHWGKSKFTICSRSSRINLRPQKQIIIIIIVIIINIKMVLRNNYYFMDIFVRFFLFGYLLLIFVIR